MNRQRSLLQKITFWFKGCAVCRSSLPPVLWLCHSCDRRLKSYYLNPQDMIRWQNGFTHIRLLDWNTENDYFIRAVINSLKGGGQSYIFNKLMQELFYRALQVLPSLWKVSDTCSLTTLSDSSGLKAKLSLQKSFYDQKDVPDSYCNSPVIVPAPPGQKNFKDHAFYLSQSLSQLSGYHFFPLLSRLDSTSVQQKQKNKSHRRQLCFQLNNNVSHLNDIIFVDDVLTTGSTAVAAREALSVSKNFIVFTLAWRQLL